MWNSRGCLGCLALGFGVLLVVTAYTSDRVPQEVLQEDGLDRASEEDPLFDVHDDGAVAAAAAGGLPEEADLGAAPEAGPADNSGPGDAASWSWPPIEHKPDPLDEQLAELFAEPDNNKGEGGGEERAAAASMPAAAPAPAATPAASKAAEDKALKDRSRALAAQMSKRVCGGKGATCPYNVLRSATPKDVRLKPYPHLVLSPALPWDQYRKLEAAYPSQKSILAHSRRWSSGKKVLPNFRYDVGAREAIDAKGQLPQVWVDFLEYHASPVFFREVVRVFGAAIRAHRPDVEAKFNKSLADLDVGLRLVGGGKKEHTAAQVVLDCQVGINTPVTRDGPSAVRGPHYDRLSELFAGLLYFRHPDDTSSGGDLQVYKCLGPCKEVPRNMKRKLGMSTKYNHEHFDPKKVSVVAKVKYERNALVFFINSFTSVHGVTPRQVSPFPRRLSNFIGETTVATLPRSGMFQGKVLG